MPQHNDLGFQPRPRLERRDQDVEEQAQERDHRASAYPISPLMPPRMRFLVWTGFLADVPPRFLLDDPNRATPERPAISRDVAVHLNNTRPPIEQVQHWLADIDPLAALELASVRAAV